MSWDIYIQDLPDVSSANDIPADFRPQPIGEREALLAAVLEVAPAAERQDLDWIFLKQPGVDLSVQVHMEDARNVRYLLVHVHGGNESPRWVARIIQRLGLRALDTATNDLFDPARPETGYEVWRGMHST